MMDHLMSEKLTKIIKTAKWGKLHQKNIKKKTFLRINTDLIDFSNRSGIQQNLLISNISDELKIEGRVRYVGGRHW